MLSLARKVISIPLLAARKMWGGINALKSTEKEDRREREMDEEEDVFLHLCRPRRGGRSGRRRNLLGVMGLFVMLGTLPVPRGPRVPRERLQWEAHAALLVEERRFKDMYRMEVACFSCQCILVDTIDSSLSATTLPPAVCFSVLFCRSSRLSVLLLRNCVPPYNATTPWDAWSGGLCLPRASWQSPSDY